MKVGRRIGSVVRLSPFGRKLYPRWADKVGRITKKEIHTVGKGLAYGQRAPYTVGYWVRWEGESRDYLLGAKALVKA